MIPIIIGLIVARVCWTIFGLLWCFRKNTEELHEAAVGVMIVTAIAPEVMAFAMSMHYLERWASKLFNKIGDKIIK